MRPLRSDIEASLIPFHRQHALALFLSLGFLHGSSAQGPGKQQPRQVLQALDLDHDGMLSTAEIKAAPSSLLVLDRNGDGVLTADEVTERPPNAGASSSELSKQLMSFDKAGKGYLVAEDLPERMQGIFRRADTNQDGKLTPDEIGLIASRQGMPAGPSTAPGRAAGMFRLDSILNALDTDHDGVISAEEIKAASSSLLTLDKNGDGQITPDEMPVRQQTAEERADHMLGEWDTDRDGRVSRAEAPERMAAQFDGIDLDHDGFLSKAELVQYFNAQGSQPRREGPPPAGQGEPRQP